MVVLQFHPYRYVKSKLQILHGYLKEGEGEEGRNLYGELFYWMGEVLGYGFLINYFLFVIFHLRFTLFTIVAWGILWWLIEKFRGRK